MSTALQLLTNTSSLNVMGLTVGQAHLYRYLVKCTKEKSPVNMHEIALIFYTHVRKVENIYSHRDEQGSHYYKKNALEMYLKRVADYPEGDSYRYYEAKNWLRGNLGSLVMRGLLTAIPAFDPDTMDTLQLTTGEK